QRATLRYAPNYPAHRRLDLRRAAAGHAVSSVWRAGHAAGGIRTVRRSGLHRRAAHRRDRLAHGVGRAARRHAAHGCDGSRAAGPGGHRHWVGRRSGAQPACAIATVRRESRRPDDSHVRRGAVGPGCPGRSAGPGAARRAHRSGVRTEVRVRPIGLHYAFMPVQSSLCLMAGMVRERAISPVELIASHLTQIAAQNPRINAFVTVLEDEARVAAKLAETAVMHGESLGLLHGVPVTIKDSFDVAGLRTLCGSRFRLGHKAAQDATSVARLRAAGAIILGKTNTPEFLSNYETDNFITGRTNNPWNLERTPGGSSGGEAAAIASFCSAGGIGSDGGGSIRIPAHFCGIAGLKPTPGRI